MRVLLLIATFLPAYGQTPTSYSLNVSIPADPARSLGAANGLFPMLVDLGAGNLAPGGFFTVAATAQFADGRMGFTCGLIPTVATVRLRYESGEELSVQPFRLPSGFGTPRAGCEPMAAVLPADAPQGTAQLTFTYLQITATLNIRVAPTWVALLTPLNQSLTRPYLGGDMVYLRTSGLGVAPVEEVTIVAGGIAVPLLSREADPAQAGFERIGFRMPEEAEDTCYLPLYLRTTTGETSPVFVPKANQPGPCRHPFQLNEEQLTTLDNNGRIWLGQPSITVYEREGIVEVGVTFQRSERWRTAAFAAPDDSRSCRVLPLTPLVVPAETLRSTLGEGGPALSLVPADGEPQVLGLTSNASTLRYFRSFPRGASSVGKWTLRGDGGVDIGAFEASVELPKMPEWTAPAQVDRSADLTVTWSGEGLTSSDRLAVAVGSGFGPYVECRTTGDAGTVTIPQRFLSILPADTVGLISMVITRHPAQRSVFSLPLANGASGVGVFDYRMVSTVQNVPFR